MTSNDDDGGEVRLEPPREEEAPGESLLLAEQPAPSVRFRSVVEEIGPDPIPSGPSASTNQPEIPDQKSLGAPGGEVTPAQIRALAQSLQGSPLQERRMNIFSFQPVSLPVTRTPSHEDDSGTSTRQNTHSVAGHSPMPSPRVPEMQSPPLTPAATGQTEVEGKRLGHGTSTSESKPGPHHELITPQDSTQEASPPASKQNFSAKGPSSSSEDIARPRSASQGKDSSRVSGHRKGMFSTGPGSVPASRDSSPSRLSASQLYSRPFTPEGDANDPYAAHRRPQQKNIEPRFQFSLTKKRQTSPSSSSTTVSKPAPDKRGLFPGRGSKDTELKRETSSTPTIQSRPGSMSDLRRFFKMGVHHKKRVASRATSPAPSVRSSLGTRVTSSSRSPQIPFGDDHGLTSKYGKLGRVLGSGAGGSVRLMKRAEDNTVFAVKEFRPRHTYETEKEYVKKLTAEYCIGSSLHHGNIIETLDIVQEKGKWYEVMEYAPYDLFAIVMTGRMTREEISCSFLQILSGVTYLHSMGLAHRDLKLDNVVVSEHGIMKIIDFGSAHVFKYPFENGINLAKGIVGSDPYLAPEVYDERKYDPAAVDIWSLAIIFCCMTLRRFPWKLPRLTDNSFKLFAAEPTPGHDPKKLVLPSPRSFTALHETPARDIFLHGDDNKTTTDKVQDSQPSKSDKEKTDSASVAPTTPTTVGTTSTTTTGTEKREVIRGPWRILRLLPRESRHVIGRMLELDPKERAKMDEIIEDAWVAHTVICRQDGPGIVVNADDHTHVLEPPSAPAPK